jgi:DNA repair protein RecO (recombination protein O)
MLHKTKGVVLRTIKYGETSIVVTVFTGLFGIQSYMVNGVRLSGKNNPGKANYFQPAAILELIVYHNELKNLQRIKEFKWSYLYENLFFDVFKNSVALFMVELLHKSLKQAESNPDLFNFVEDAFIHLDKSDETVVANYPLFFCLQLINFFGFRFSDEYSEQNDVLDLQEGLFVAERPSHPYFIEGELAFITSQLLKVMQPAELRHIRLNHETRRTLLSAYQSFYALHIQDFGTLKTLPVLQEVLR